MSSSSTRTLVRLKYGNRDPDIYTLVEKAIALAGEK